MTNTGQTIKSLPIAHMVSAPILAAIQAQQAAAKSFADFFTEVCLHDDGGVKMIRLRYMEQELDGSGNPTGTSVERVVDAPFFGLIPLPVLCIEKVAVDFELEVTTAEETKSSTDASLEAKVKYGFGPWGVSVKGKVSHHRESTRKSDTRSKYSFHVEAVRPPVPEALSRILDHVLNGTSNPVDAKDAPKLQADKDKAKAKKAA